MIIIDTPFHISFTDGNEKPTSACIGKCKLIWWPSDVNQNIKLCKKCAGKIETAIENKHYKILRKHNNRLSLNDFKKHLPNLSKTDKELIKSYTKGTEKVGLLSLIKTEFSEKEKQGWL